MTEKELTEKPDSVATIPVPDELQMLRKRVLELEQLEKEYRKNLEELAQKEAFNFALFNYNPVLTTVVDTNGRVVKSNAAKLKSGDRIPKIGDIMYIDYASKHEIDMYSELMSAMKSNTIKKFPELKYKDKFISVTISPFPQGAIITSQDITLEKTSEKEKIDLINHLQRALDEVETLRGLLPICASCKKIRDDNGYWNHIELYISQRTQADFTHTLCPECLKHYYPEYWQKMKKPESNA